MREQKPRPEIPSSPPLASVPAALIHGWCDYLTSRGTAAGVRARQWSINAEILRATSQGHELSAEGFRSLKTQNIRIEEEIRQDAGDVWTTLVHMTCPGSEWTWTCDDAGTAFILDGVAVFNDDGTIDPID